MLAVATIRRAPKEELRTGTLPAIHASLADVLNAVRNAGLGFAGDVKRADAGRVMFCETDRPNGESYNCAITVMTYNARSHRFLQYR